MGCYRRGQMRMNQRFVVVFFGVAVMMLIFSGRMEMKKRRSPEGNEQCQDRGTRNHPAHAAIVSHDCG
jgi:hypothetical protein